MITVETFNNASLDANRVAICATLDASIEYVATPTKTTVTA